MKKRVLLVGCSLLLSGCGAKGVTGSWELAQTEQNDCPVYYTFETVVKEDENNKQEITQVVSMYTNEKKEEDLSKGTYALLEKEDSYLLDYGDSFVSKQQMKRKGNKLEIYFDEVEKLCTYKLVTK